MVLILRKGDRSLWPWQAVAGSSRAARARDADRSLSVIVRQVGGEVHKRNRAASRELRQDAVPSVDRLRLDKQRVQGLLEEAVRLGLRLCLDERRLRVAFGLGDFCLGERLLALQLV